MKVFSFGDSDAKQEKREKVKLKLRNPFNHNKTFSLEVILTDIITNAEVPIPNESIREICNLKGIKLSEKFNKDFCTNEIGLLIGSDYLWDFYTGKVKRFSKHLVAVETIFGYCLSGTQNFYDKNAVALNINTEYLSEMDNNLSEQIKAFWELDSLGIKDSTAELSKKDTEIIEEFEKEIKFENNKYTVKLPWNANAQRLSNNFRIAKKRLVNLTARFKSKSEYLSYEEYDKVIKDQIEQDIVEEVSVSPDIEEITDKIYYMPHHGVIREDKITTKLRIVFDCSSHEKGFSSLNNCLLPGPNLNPDLLTVLLKFRRHKVAFVADIEKAFLMISVAKEDQDCQRFLWLKNIMDEPIKLKIMKMKRVTFGVCSSPFLLAATIKYHIRKFNEEFPEAVSMLSEDLYVDDLISGTETVKDACNLTKQSKDIMEKASMKLRKWQTNSEELKQYWKTKEIDVGIEENYQSPLKVLGITWNSKEDEFKLDLSMVLKFLKDEIFTKRKVLQTTCTIFDPIGLISPFLIRMKILFQKLWEKGLKWDDELPEDLHHEWTEWCKEVPMLKALKIPRSYLQTINEDTELHIFCDASLKAYGAVAYLRSANWPPDVSFVASKSRVAPLKRLTLPRLELMGALIAARLGNYLQRALGIKENKLFLWTDSTIALSWLQGHASDWKPFVSNRVEEIQDLTDPQYWSHCSGRNNPADRITRGCSAERLLTEENWWKGPTWLAENKKSWPKVKIKSLSEKEAEEERRRNPEQSIQLLCHTELEPLLNINDHSNLHKVLRITGWVLRFIYNIRNKNSRKTNFLSAEELDLSEKYWIKRIQHESFQAEIKLLNLNKDIPTTSSIYQFNPILDNEGILRIGGRLHSARLEFNEKHPVIMPTNNYFTDLLIVQNHVRVGHGGVADTLSQLRDNFWVIKGRQRVKRIINNCLICRRFNVKPATQDMAPLPPDRINEAFPFEVCGVDFAGPLYTKDERGKAYIVLFTCAVTRAVHLETVSDLTTEKFLLAFRRFISRRGICKIIYSDNAKTFKRAEKDIKYMFKLIEDPEVLNFFGKQGITWKYIVERAAWWGGFWERMVRSTKTCLKKIIGKKSLMFEELETVLTEVEAILNSRPLTYVYSENREPEPLTPGHFLIGRRLISLPNKTPEKVISTGKTLNRRYKHRIVVVNQFWKIWKKHYLLDLRSAHEIKKSKCPTKIQVDDLVFIGDSNLPRMMWKLGAITEIHPGRDGKVRACTVKLPNGTFLKRPVQLLYPLELSRSD